MATVKINCPKCAGIGLTGEANLVVCTQCAGVGTISVQDTDTVAAVQAANVSQSNFVVTKPTPIPAAAVKVVSKGKGSLDR